MMLSFNISAKMSDGKQISNSHGLVFLRQTLDKNETNETEREMEKKKEREEKYGNLERAMAEVVFVDVVGSVVDVERLHHLPSNLSLHQRVSHSTDAAVELENPQGLLHCPRLEPTEPFRKP